MTAEAASQPDVTRVEPRKPARPSLMYSLRTISSFALLGVVVAGLFLGWHQNADTFRLIGAGFGLAVGLVAYRAHLI